MFTNSETDTDLIHDVDLILRNQEPLYSVAREACLESVRNDDAATNDPDAYAYAHKDQSGADWNNFCVCAGIAVSHAVLDLIEQEVKEGFVYDILTQRLDLGNQHAWACIAEKFMPDPENV